jgi:hypothetical protein
MNSVDISTNSLNEALFFVVVAAVIAMSVLLIGYYFFFARGYKVPAWKAMDKKLMLMELDKLYEFALKKRFNTKESLGSILKNQSNKFTRDALDDIWMAHKLRNKMVHDVDFKLNPSEINHAIIILKKGIQNLWR